MSKNLFTKISLSLAFSAVVIFTTYAQILSGRIGATAVLDGMQNGVSTMAHGVATVMLNPTKDTACINISWNGLSGAVTGIHIHDGKPGTSGAAIMDLDPFVAQNRCATSVTGSAITIQFIQKLLQGDLYINIHTAAYPNGEIRGQLHPSSDIKFTSVLNGTQAGTTSTAMGLGVFILSKDMNRMWYRVITEGATSKITSAHLHKGAIGTSGAVITDLTSDISTDGYIVSGSINTNQDTSFLNALMQGNLYINLHNDSFPNGEIRGQVNITRSLSASAFLDGTQAGTSATGMGVGTFFFTPMLDSMFFVIMVEGLSNPISSIHIHSGMKGTSGAVVEDLGFGIIGNQIRGVITGSTVSQLLAGIMTGGLYVNVHTTTNPNGEIRGQIYPPIREVIPVSINGQQNGTNSSGAGSGYISIDAQGINAEVFYLVDNMTTQPNGSHLHKAPKGTSGSVLVDIDTFFVPNNKGGWCWTFWQNNMPSTPLDWASISLILHDSVYLNLHTTAFPNGEIRGQFIHDNGCYTLATGIAENNFTAENIVVYPNPANNFIYIKLPETEVKNISNISVTDMQGRKISLETKNIFNLQILNVGELQQGLYIISLQMKDKIYNITFVKM